MYGVYLFLLILSTGTSEFTSDDECVQCNNNTVKQIYHEDVNGSNVDFNSLVDNYCTIKDPNKINWDVKFEYLTVTYEALKCNYTIALLVNPLIKDERKCMQYKFEVGVDSEIHTKKVMNYFNNDETDSEHFFNHVFTGCYALHFHINKKDIVTKSKFINTPYKREEITSAPWNNCTQFIHSNLNESHEITNYTLNIFIPPFAQLNVTLIRNYIKTDSCSWLGHPPLQYWMVQVTNDLGRYEVRDNPYCSAEEVKVYESEGFMVQCKLQVETANDIDYCFRIQMFENRCEMNTVWKPFTFGTKSCMWVRDCIPFEHLHVERVNEIKSDESLSKTKYLLLAIISLVLFVLAIVGMSYSLNYLRICQKGRINVYVNPQQDFTASSTSFKSFDFNITDNKEKKINHLAYNDIVLLYTKGSTSFMTLMKDFRETLSKMCPCFVHDWHDGAEWNDVATIGAVSWFTKLLNAGCRVVWVDTPATRSAIMSKGSNTNLNKLNKYCEMGDFRDITFPVVLELAKRNTNGSMYSKHFVVRFEGLESSENVNDPFLDLSPHVRYLMPQHFEKLCSDLLVKSEISKYEMKAEEDLLQERLKLMKESIM